MAGKQHTINLPGDTQVQVPAWASEDTLERMLLMTQNSNKLADRMLKGAEAITEIDEELVEAVQSNIKTGIENAKTNEAEVKGKANVLIKGAQAIKDTAGFFGDSEKPLTSMVSAAEGLVKKLQGPQGKGGLDKLTSKFPPFGKFLKGYGGQIAGVATDIVLALAGWNAAKFEQFAEVQKTMIDSGAIIFETSDMFNELYTQSFRAGITYKTFADVVANFGGTMTAIGGDVSQGSVTFLKMFKRMSEGTDDLGDLGMLNKDLMNAYAQYIEAMRLTGGIDRLLIDQGRGLEKGFRDLVVESTAMASLTALNRSDIFQRTLAALSDQSLAAGAQILRRLGFDKSAAMAETLVSQMAMFADLDESGMTQTLITAINTATSQFAGNMADFDIRHIINKVDKDMLPAMENSMGGLLDEIDSKMRNAEDIAALPKNWVLKEMNQRIDMTKWVSDAMAGTGVGKVQSWQNVLLLIQKNLGNFQTASDADWAAALKKTRKEMDESGTTTVAMNNMAKMFLTAQEFITLPMQKFGEVLQFVTDGIASGTGKLVDGKLSVWGDYTEEPNSGVVDSDHLFGYDVPQLQLGPIYASDLGKKEGGDTPNEVFDKSAFQKDDKTTAFVVPKTLKEANDRLTYLNDQRIMNETETSRVIKNQTLRWIENQVMLINEQVKILQENNRLKENIAHQRNYQKAAFGIS